MKISYLTYEPLPELSRLASRMELLAALGYDGIELSASHPAPYPVEKIQELSDRFRLPVVSFLTGWSYSNEGLCLSSPKADVRARAVERLSEYAEIAGKLGAVIVVGLMQGFRSDEPDETVAGNRIADCLRQVASVAVQNGTMVVIEPVNHLQVGFHHTAGEVAELVRRVDSGGLSYMLDTIHMNIEERSIEDTIREHVGRIRHFHLCETNGGPFGTGNLDFANVLKVLHETRYEHYVSVKIYRKLPWDQAARKAAEFLKL